MNLDDLRKKVIFQNSIDVWISTCDEKNIDWQKPDDYKRFIKFLRDGDLNLKKYSLCVSDAESMDEFDRKKAKFAETLSELKDPDAETYTVKLNDAAVSKIREFSN
ncbi:MAG: hypothetical protein R3230_04140 [Nitrosopumilaceae archaeon]|nr:hypothetical protein [Nitrosopumilaceae archaeon]